MREEKEGRQRLLQRGSAPSPSAHFFLTAQAKKNQKRRRGKKHKKRELETNKGLDQMYDVLNDKLLLLLCFSCDSCLRIVVAEARKVRLSFFLSEKAGTARREQWCRQLTHTTARERKKQKKREQKVKKEKKRKKEKHRKERTSLFHFRSL